MNTDKIANLTFKRSWMLKYLKAHTAFDDTVFVSPTEVGREYGKAIGKKGYHSAQASTTLTYLVNYGLADYNKHGHYKISFKGLRVVKDLESEDLERQKTERNFICCGVLEQMDIGWMQTENGLSVMPYINGREGKKKYRINKCPSCGTYVRDSQMKR